MPKNVKIDFDQKKILKKVEKLAEEKAESIRNEMESSANNSTSMFYQPANTFCQQPGITYGKHKIMCPNCLKMIAVKIGTNSCPLCDHKIEVTENTKFLD